MKEIKDSNYYKWSADKGDYKRDEDATTSYQKRKNLRKRIKSILLIILYFVIVVALTLLVFSNI